MRAMMIASMLMLVPLATPAMAEECYSRQDLAARAAGFLVRVVVADGQAVKKGDVLAELDARLHATAVAEAKAGADIAGAKLALAKDALKRLTALAASDTVSPQELFNAKIAVTQAAAGLAQAKAVRDRTEIQLADTQIKADIDGKVSGLPHVKGLYVQAGQSLGRVEAAASTCNASK